MRLRSGGIVSLATATIYSRVFELSWDEFRHTNPELDDDDGHRAYLAGWSAMYANLSGRA